MQDFTTKTIREIAVAMPVTTRIFENYKIDYCCGGERNFFDACQFAGVSPETIRREINLAVSKHKKGFAQDELETASELIDFIVKKHHAFTRNEITRLSDLMEKVCHRHSGAHRELIALQQIFRKFSDDLISHLKKEETVLFPFIKHLEMSEAKNLSGGPHPPFGTVKNPVRMMMVEHDHTGDFLRKMREITKEYALPENICSSFQALYVGLKDFEKDLHHHIHLENNVLFPKAVRLEQKVIYGY